MKNKMFAIGAVALGVVAVASCGKEETTGAAFVVKGKVAANEAPSTGRVGAASAATEGPAIGSPSYINIKMYGLWLSASADCSNPVQVADFGAAGVEKIFSDNPTLFEGNPPAGTYKCIIMKMSDVINFKSNTAGSACDTTTTYSMDIYRSDCAVDHGDGIDGVWKDVNLTATACTGSRAAPTDDGVYTVATRDSAAAIARGFSPHQVLTLTTDLVSPGNTTFKLKTKDTIVEGDDSGTAYCGMNAFEMAFE